MLTRYLPSPMSKVANVSCGKEKVVGSRRRVDVRWKEPQRDWICRNTDGALLCGVTCCGGVFRDSSGV
ncbi:unnamed protein product [Trifolium pratense]|uniref:Uncharacterized protein n=1 Tax=Trifolium pratense TaxID=57577 RepID=A0ACB0L0C4_TRIPR|nr:unnamed protein product [Trifolium pratense]